MIKDWIFETTRAYIGNATAVREYRTQLRGTKPIWTWFAYLAFLIIMSSAFYGSASSQDKVGIATMQMNLKFFYYSLGGLLATIVCLGAPALTASAITLERQRKSLDLLFSAPVSPRYLIIGKMISSFRYLFMLLVLSLPFVSIGVVMGGATWAEVFSALWLLILNGMVLCGLGILISALSESVIAGIIYSYIAVAGYLIYTSLFSLTTWGSLAVSMVGGPMSHGTREAPWIGCLNPFSATLTAGTITKVYGMDVPNWVIATVVSFLITNWLILGASSALSGKDSREVKTFRVISLIYTFLLGLLVGQMILSTMFFAGLSGSPPSSAATPSTPAMPSLGQIVGSSIMFAAMSILGFAVHLYCYAKETDRKYRSGGLFSFKSAFGGGTEGSLIFSILILSCFTVGVLLFVSQHLANVFDVNFAGQISWSFALLVFNWAICRWASAYVRDLKPARGLCIALAFMIFGLPIPCLTVIFQERVGEFMWLWIGYPFLDPKSGFYWALGMILVSVVLINIGERKRTEIKQVFSKPPPPTQFEV